MNANSHELPELGNYNYNLTDRFPIITGKYGGDAVTYDRKSGWVWHDEDGGRGGYVSGVWTIRRGLVEGDWFWKMYRNSRYVAALPVAFGWLSAVDVAVAIQGELDYEAADHAPRAIDDDSPDSFGGPCGNYHNTDYTYPYIPGPAGTSHHLYNRITGWVWTDASTETDTLWTSGSYTIALVAYGWDLYYKGAIIGVCFGLWSDAENAALNWENYIKHKYGQV